MIVYNQFQPPDSQSPINTLLLLMR